ncbi:TNF receptor-associated factor 6 isoform X1 [Zootermopsis nevadensis]|uniref:TNF receptor-associated factor 6 n=1 Tax=Zootermopsis nevadensis TaxID=136037 RepID=A0A067RFW6_ZOONE|nr:TNF receptor-associated factor 6 isoform X1 [Zootermopsis nevadensis]XP_021912933.1 TNF receptor-associated factor 6 isoform X1 [Zootermopsis nevadensis]XP_021912934.1 TNF receptor-associated factor 6 isoform X1 [Zootermopsis nevadensis]XP_021912936.1 TNF receptor-associated factor 6 isoform X1 [Zootermopsis nevadensis]XP_021912937.1 TNF receptor-associated factor 6 isoform X1 [Zootermopsis nevadensis]XP_021912938.1 TNF receptor-associated factor 6 isoform X1 [Zootermopsis nevadensis]XP_02
MAVQEARGGCAQESSIPSLEGDKALEARFECPICLQCLSEPVLTPCGHRFCNACIHKWLQREGGVCPVDNMPLNAEKDLFPDNFTRREIQELDVKKPQKGQDLGSQMVDCSFREVGCLASVHPDELVTHLDTQIHYHTSLLNAAYSKLQVSMQEKKVDAKAQEASNLWEPDSKGHMNGDVQQSWQGLLRSLYERIVVLEQRNREQDIQLENMKRQLFANIDQVSQDLALRYCNGTYLWTVTQISKKLVSMATNPTRSMFYSPGFYTAPNGYRFCARLNLSPNDHSHIALHIHLMRTGHDDSLSWPFTGRITFMLVNATDSSRHICDTVMSRPELHAFKRPLRDMNLLGFGYTEFVSVHDLLISTQGFVTPDDSILIKLHILSV